MTKIITYTFGILMLLTVFSCKKKVAEVNSDYVGYWSASDTDGKSYGLSIESNSRAVYSTQKGITSTEIKGNARIKGSKLKVFTKKFAVDQEPLANPNNPGTYTMILDGLTYTAWK